VTAGLYVAATLDIGDVEKGFDAMKRRARALGPAFRELKKPLKLDQKDHSKKRQGSRRAKKPMGRLPGATRYSATATSVSGVSKALWSGAQQDGAIVGHGSRLPSRPFLWISDDMLTIAENTLGAALVRAYGGN
jgi:hypothetical protein